MIIEKVRTARAALMQIRCGFPGTAAAGERASTFARPPSLKGNCT